jgi:hypothetical protein
MHELLSKLTGGDRRSIRGVPEVVAQVLAEPALFPIVLDGMSHADAVLRMRCADAVEKITVEHPEFLSPYAKRLIQLGATAEQPELRWHLAQLFSRLKLTAAQRRRIAEILNGYLSDTSRIVKTFAMQALADLAAQDAQLRPPIVAQLKKLTRTGSPAMRARGRKLLTRLGE